MSEILNIEELRKMAHPIIDIPGFSPGETIKVKVQQPNLLKMARNGTIPNALLNVAAVMTMGEKVQLKEDAPDEDKLKAMNDVIELYNRACLVEPSFDDFFDLMTDAQKGHIFSWAIGQASDLNSFREAKSDGGNNKSSKQVQKKTK